MRQEGTAGTDAVLGEVFIAIYDRAFLVGPGFFAGVANGMILGYLMLTEPASAASARPAWGQELRRPQRRPRSCARSNRTGADCPPVGSPHQSAQRHCASRLAALIDVRNAGELVEGAIVGAWPHPARTAAASAHRNPARPARGHLLRRWLPLQRRSLATAPRPRHRRLRPARRILRPGHHHATRRLTTTAAVGRVPPGPGRPTGSAKSNRADVVMSLGPAASTASGLADPTTSARGRRPIRLVA